MHTRSSLNHYESQRNPNRLLLSPLRQCHQRHPSTTKRLVVVPGVDETQVIHLALHQLVPLNKI